MEKDGLDKLRNSKVMVFGVGGVGSFTVEALTRAGSYNNKAMMALIDMDSITFDDKGNIHGVNEAVKNAQEQFPQGFKPSEDEKPKKTLTSYYNKH